MCSSVLAVTFLGGAHYDRDHDHNRVCPDSHASDHVGHGYIGYPCYVKMVGRALLNSKIKKSTNWAPNPQVGLNENVGETETSLEHICLTPLKYCTLATGPYSKFTTEMKS